MVIKNVTLVQSQPGYELRGPREEIPVRVELEDGEVVFGIVWKVGESDPLRFGITRYNQFKFSFRTNWAPFLEAIVEHETVKNLVREHL